MDLGTMVKTPEKSEESPKDSSYNQIHPTSVVPKLDEPISKMH